MNLVEMKCRNCGAKLDINNETKEASCRFCGMVFKIDGDLPLPKEVEEKVEVVETMPKTEVVVPQEIEEKKEESSILPSIGNTSATDELIPGGNKKLADKHLITRLKAIALATFLLLSGHEAIKALDNKNTDNVDNNKQSIEYINNANLTPEEIRQVDELIEKTKGRDIQSEEIAQAVDEIHKAYMEGKKEEELALIAAQYGITLDPNYYEEMSSVVERPNQSVENNGVEKIHQAAIEGKTQSEVEAIAAMYGIELDPNYCENIRNEVEELYRGIPK